jgi:hypothetical protein
MEKVIIICSKNLSQRQKLFSARKISTKLQNLFEVANENIACHNGVR